MNKKNTLQQIILFTIFIGIVLSINRFIKGYLFENEITDYKSHLLVKTFTNIILASVSFLVAKKLNLLELGGLTNIKPKKLWLTIFPLVFLTLLNGLFLDTIPNYDSLDMIVLAIYCLGIGFAEELSLRGVLLPLISRYFGDDRKAQIKAVFISALIFGLLHLLKFDKGIYGEISQVFYATFIGVMFGAVLLVIKRVYPLIIIHAAIDFVAKLDAINLPAKETVSNPMDLVSALVTTIVTIPCLIYGMFVIKKYISNKKSVKA